jgi:hypothetical protein
MGLFDRMKTRVSSRAWPGAAEWIPPARVSPPPQPAPPPFAANETYLRLWLTQARLSHSRKWFTEWHPVVHAAVARRYGKDRVEEQVAVIHPGAIPGFDGIAAAAVTLEKELTPLLPFPGGTMSLNAGLVAVKGDNSIRKLIDVIGGFGGLITATALATGTGIANQVIDGFETLFDLGGDVGTLAYDGTLALAGGGAARALAPGYLVVLEEPQAPNSLWVRDGELMTWPAHGSPTRPACSYLLLRLESRTDRDDWLHLDEIEKPFLAARGSADDVTRRALYQQAIIAARTSPDLHEADRCRVAVALQGMRDTDAGFGAVEGLPGSLTELAGTITLTREEALQRKPSLAALLA